MRKSAMLLSALLLAGILFSGCSIIPDNTSATSSESTINSILASELDRVLQDGPELEAMPIDYNPKDYGRIFPNIVEFTEDMWEKEKDSACFYIDIFPNTDSYLLTVQYSQALFSMAPQQLSILTMMNYASSDQYSKTENYGYILSI